MTTYKDKNQSSLHAYRNPGSGEVVKTGLSLATPLLPTPVLLLFRLGFASPSMVSTSLIDGRSLGDLAVHSTAIRSTSSISSRTCSHWPPMLASSNSSTPRLLLSRSRTHPTMSRQSPNSGSMGRFPVSSSMRTTPKLYMSLF